MTGPLASPAPKKPVAAIIGGVLLVLSVVLGLVGLIVLGRNVGETIKAAVVSDDDLQGRTPIPGTASVHLTPGRYVVVALGKDLRRSSCLDPPTETTTVDDVESCRTVRNDFVEPNVTITGPGEGTSVEVDPTDSASNLLLLDLDDAILARFEVTTAGTYRIRTEAGLGEPATATVDAVAVAARPPLSEPVRRAVAGGVMAAFAGLLFLVGLITLIVGLVTHGRRRTTVSAPGVTPGWASPMPGGPTGTPPPPPAGWGTAPPPPPPSWGQPSPPPAAPPPSSMPAPPSPTWSTDPTVATPPPLPDDPTP